MVRASAHGSLRVMIPMIASMVELDQVKRLLSQAIAEVDARGLKRAAEIRHRKQCHLVCYSQLDGRSEECVDCLAYLRHQSTLAIELCRMSIEAADLCEENLALHVDACSRIGARFDQERNLFQLTPQRRIGKHCGQGGVHTTQRIIRLNGS